MKLPLPLFNRRIIKIIPVLHGARWLLNKDIVHGANSYPLKGIVGENRTRATPFLSSRQGDERTRTKDTTLTRGGTGSEIIGSGITTGSKASKQTIFLARGQRRRRAQREQRKGGRWLKATEKEEWLLLALRRILIELLAAFLSLLFHARTALSVFGFV